MAVAKAATSPFTRCYSLTNIYLRQCDTCDIRLSVHWARQQEIRLAHSPESAHMRINFEHFVVLFHLRRVLKIAFEQSSRSKLL